MNPVVMNVTVATRDRIENLAIPQTACPLVQPLPIRVPKPTRKPPVPSSQTGKPTLKGFSAGLVRCTKNAPLIMPIKKAIRQKSSERCGLNKPPIMPLIPAMRPLNNNKIVAARPINNPPEKADTGVKFSNLSLYGLVRGEYTINALKLSV